MEIHEDMRDFFAIQILAAIISRQADSGAIDYPWEKARTAYDLADIMIEVRQKKGTL